MFERLSRFLKAHRHYVFVFLIQLALAGFFFHEWDGFVFLTSTQQFLEGTSPYQIGLEAPPYVFCSPFETVENWYSYPPLPLLMFCLGYAPYFYLGGDNPIIARILLKITFILGNLLCAYLVYRFVAGVSSQEKAHRAEKLTLYNPFLIYIAAVWGMFDIWMVNFVLLSLLCLRRGRWSRGGISLGLSILTKPLTLLFAPLFTVQVWNKSQNLLKPLLFLLCTAAIFMLVSLPFILQTPEGFNHQVIGEHADRPPFAWSTMQLLYGRQSLNEYLSVSFIPWLPSSTITVISVILMIIAAGIIILYYRLYREESEKSLLTMLFLTMLCFVVFSRGVSPQHLVIPIVLSLTLLYAYSDYKFMRQRDLRHYYKIATFCGLGAAILNGRHFLHFLQPDVAVFLTGKTALELEEIIASSFPISPYLYYTLVEGISGALIICTMVIAAIILLRAMGGIIPAIARKGAGVVLWTGLISKRRLAEKTAAVSLVGAFIFIPLLAGAADYHTTERNQSPPSSPSSFYREDKLSGVLYYYWWRNSSFDPEKQYDNWQWAGLTPQEGYYHLNQAYIRDDILQMKQAGIDFAILSISGEMRENYNACVLAAEKEDFHFTPLIELYNLDIDKLITKREALGSVSEVKEDLLNKIDIALARRNSPAYLWYEDKPVVFLHPNVYFVSEGTLASPYNEEQFWQGIKSETEEKYHEDIFWVADYSSWWEEGKGMTTVPACFDAVFFISPSIVWVGSDGDKSALAAWRMEMEELKSYCSAQNLPYIATVTPCYNDSTMREPGMKIPQNIGDNRTYDLLWGIALEGQPNLVIIASWNEYFESSGIEPTKEYGSWFLERTPHWSGRLTASSQSH